VGEPDPQAHGPHLCEHRPLSGNQRPRRLNAPTPTLATSRRQPATTGCPSCTVTQARRASRDGSSSLLDPASDAVYVGAESRATANGRRSSAGQHRYIAAIDEKAGRATSARPGRQGSPQREPALPRRQLESRVREAQGRVILLERGLDRSPVAAAGQAVVRRTYPESLDDWLVLRVINSFTAPFTIFTETSPKSLGAYASNVIRTY